MKIHSLKNPEASVPLPEPWFDSHLLSISNSELYEASFISGAIGTKLRLYIGKTFGYAYSTWSNNPNGAVYHVLNTRGRPACGLLNDRWTVRSGVRLSTSPPEDRRRCGPCKMHTCSEF